jgi:predicted negative regulator of RcsB-dependent stress response
VSQYDGLSLSQLLNLMHGLVMPEPVAWLPQTAGSWMIIGWLIAVVLLAGWQLIRRRRRNRYRRDALAELKAIDTSSELAPVESAQRIAALLKRTALVAYPRREVAALFGKDWAQFLSTSANNDKQIADAADMLASASYRPDADGRVLSQPARRWIRLHHD